MDDVMNEDRWEDIVSSFLRSKHSNELKSYLDKLFKDLKKSYEKLGFFKNDQIKYIFDARKNKPLDDQSQYDFIVAQLRALNEFNDKPQHVDILSLLEDVFINFKELNEKYDVNRWLSKSSGDAKNISFGTHVPKLTHSAIKTKPIVSKNNKNKAGLITTSRVPFIKYDSVASNAYSQIREFFSLELSGVSLYEIFSNEENSVLRSFACDECQLKEWNSGFLQALEVKDLVIDPLLKQVYFPISKAENSYHLLSQVESSSLSIEIFCFIEKKREELASLTLGTRSGFPKVAQLFVTSGKNILSHGNVSQLNAIRKGAKYLFSCQPPVWHSQLKPPIYTGSFFYELSRNYEVKENIQYLSDFLTRFENLQLSIKDPKRMRWLVQWVENLVDEVLVYVKTIQALPSGWSAIEGVKLKTAHQVLLDCYRQDEQFLEMKNSSDWQAVVIQDFANWLNNRLTKVNEQFTPQDSHTKLWRTIFKDNFSEGFDIEGLTQEEITV
ncbi:type I-F CRISPR-associated protein Csy1 [Saccharobesus litoralis]|uniref:Type I-F CRISPR-associated protein Csy1 n=1 Tax=Saccharobesus litoralis TaxID=2172099 RepID=A0A2S0VSU4_9ALTE|nr:type I-F CRISPR-associated protein Csy1 [Saccharobesus litoralis]AWB67285.1 type I-F CRISPR-associated protein Csy1 [Saccharobesus litoralis]